jgi:uroporphyrin-III C-methyltransferase/precorrin-2 dehydrogenase/sirohydrochlorin ferrochelatase
MDHFPIFVRLEGRRVLVAGGGEAALAKLRLLLKTRARLTVAAADPAPEILAWAAEGRVALIRRAVAPGDALCCVLAYAAHDDAAADARAHRLMRADGALVNVVDDLGLSQFITPAIVDRDPVVVAIGTEGAAPVLARRIKARVEAMLPPATGLLARVAKPLRALAEALPAGAARRRFWSDYYETAGPRAAAQGEGAVRDALRGLLDDHLRAEARPGLGPRPGPRPGHVDLVGAGPGDPELLTLKARATLDRADVVIHDRLVSAEVLELARREAVLLSVGKEGFGPSARQADINALMIRHAREGAHVVRLKSGDPGVFGRLDEEADALEAAGVRFAVIPGITAASAAAAGMGRSLTRRGRNGELRMVTGHDAEGFSDPDWRALAAAGAVTAVYMGKRAARRMQGRLLMHGADPATPVSVVENASRPEGRTVAATLATLPRAVEGLTGPAVILLGLAPRDAAARLARPGPAPGPRPAAERPAAALPALETTA